MLAEASAVIAADRPAYDRYGDLDRLIERRDRELARTFDDLRRSTARLRLLGMWSLHLLDEADIAGLTDETRQWLLAMRLP